MIGKTVLITRPGHKSRQLETIGIKQFFEEKEHGYTIVEIQDSSSALLDGGDVLYTGREIFVGLSRRTNLLGAQAVSNAFPGKKVTTIPLQNLVKKERTNRSERDESTTLGKRGEGIKSVLHLKSLATVLGPDTLVIADTELGRALAFYIQDSSGIPKIARQSGHRISFVTVPDIAAANVIFVNNTILCQSSIFYPRSYENISLFSQAAGLQMKEIDTSELGKADGALTCCSILM